MQEPQKREREEEREHRQPYSRPAMVEFGAIVALTQGDS